MKQQKQRYIYYLYDGDFIEYLKPLSLPDGYQLKVWKPSIFSIAPKNLMSFTFLVWWLFHFSKIFSTCDYKIYLVYKGTDLAHYTVLLPAHFRFPFMKKNDLQIGPIGTYTIHRRCGLAIFIINQILTDYKTTKNRFWYVVRAENIPSQKLIERFNFIKFREGIKERMFFLKIFRIYKE